MLNRRSFLQGLGTIALAGGLSGCASGSKSQAGIGVEAFLDLFFV